jgi:hypothetical protein
VIGSGGTSVSGEEQLQQDAEPEGRQRHARDRQDAGEMVERAVALQRREDAERHPERDADRHRDQNELERRREVARDLGQDGAGGHDGAAEIAAGQIAEIDHELHGKRLVEAVFAPHGLDHVGGGLGTGDQTGRIARRHIGDQEGEDRQAEHRAGDRQQLVEREAQHGRRAVYFASIQSG